jgi:hypothetical protein
MKNFLLHLFFVATCVLFTSRIEAQSTLSLQGTIRNSSGTAVSDGNYSMTFRLYTAESGGTPVWTETQNNIKVVGGVYSALLGVSTPLDAAFNVPYFVGISVDGGSEMIPRFRLTSAPYARALIGQSNTFPSAGPVGVGTASPQSGVELHVNDGSSGDATILVSSASSKSPILQLKQGTTVAEVDISSGFLNVDGGSALHTRLVGKGQERLKTTDSGVGVTGNMAVSGNSTVTGDETVSGDLSVTGDVKVTGVTELSGGAAVGGALFVKNLISSQGGENLILARGAATHIACSENFTAFTKHVYISGFESITTTPHWKTEYPGQGPTWTSDVGGSKDIGLSVEKSIRTTAIRIFSDARIKKDVRTSSSFSDLETLMKLRVADYKYIDTLKFGVRPTKGFIAQEVEKVYPVAVKTMSDVVPDIYECALKCDISGDQATFTLHNPHKLQVGDRVRLYLSNNQEIFDVVAVGSDRTFTVSGWEEKGEPEQPFPFFVYGKETGDFKEVDYNSIHNLNVSATQELARQVEELRAENAELRSKYELILRASESVNGRLAKLEALLDSSASKR